tara:strand:- start:330 stop:458 length:129 start_codon:yes stop_codon:yes gene_type:complete
LNATLIENFFLVTFMKESSIDKPWMRVILESPLGVLNSFGMK